MDIGSLKYFKDYQIYGTCKIRYLVMPFSETENSIRELGLVSSLFIHQFIQPLLNIDLWGIVVLGTKILM